VQLILDEREAAIESAEIALQFSDPSLLGDEGLSDGFTSASRQACRLSAHLTLGLASSETSAANEAFTDALQESSDDPAVTLLLAQVLFASGDASEQVDAKARLESTISKHADILPPVILSTAISILDRDTDALRRLKPQLHALRCNASDPTNAIPLLIIASAPLLDPSPDAALATVKSETIIQPWTSEPWTLLAGLTRDQHAADMALLAAQKTSNAPSSSSTGRASQASNLAAAFANTGRVGDAQRAVALAPWLQQGWDSLKRSIPA
jgi:superkiller protein 3